MINPRVFSGERTGNEFVSYVGRHATVIERIPFASPEVVWYMRIAVPDWEIYVQKIVRDARAGVPAGVLDGAERVARELGVAGKYKDRFVEARRALALA